LTLRYEITKWNDPQIKALNPRVSLSAAAAVVVVHRAGGSGRTYVWANWNRGEHLVREEDTSPSFFPYTLPSFFLILFQNQEA
jgi:ABC-type phosphate transport system substrate-binding protein